MDSASCCEDGSEYYRFDEVAAPHAGQALYMNHPTLGWVPVLDQDTDIERDTVVIAVGNPDTGAFEALYQTFYSNYVDVILNADAAGEVFPDRVPAGEFEPADSTVSSLPASTPGCSNLAESEEEPNGG